MLSAGLSDPHDSVRRSAILAVAYTRHSRLIGSLRETLGGTRRRVRPLTGIPLEESIDVPIGFDDVAGKRDLKEVAALALGFLNDEESRDVIAKLSGESPMYDVALALLGDFDRLRPAHFRTSDSNMELQMAAVEVVVRSRGRVGLPLALNYRVARYGWEPDRVAAKLSAMLVEENAPGKEMLVANDQYDQFKKWFDKHGQEFIAKQRSK